MNNPIAVFQQLRELYIRYLDSPLAIRYDALRETAFDYTWVLHVLGRDR